MTTGSAKWLVFNMGTKQWLVFTQNGFYISMVGFYPKYIIEKKLWMMI